MTHHEKITNMWSCLVCNKLQLKVLPEYGAIQRVTSDCRAFHAGGILSVCMDCGAIQKCPNQQWLDEISEIYSKYDAYHQGSGSEQIVFDENTGSVRRRSDVIIGNLIDEYNLPSRGKALDIGCGSGVTIQTLSQRLSNWELYGQDLDQRNEQRLHQIRNFEKLFDCTPDAIKGTYDLITLIHSLEHFPSPKGLLQAIASKLTPNGILLIQVCNTNQNPYDLLIADHLMHFSPHSLKNLAEHSGFHVHSIETKWVTKELTLIGRYAKTRENQPNKPLIGGASLEFTQQQLQWLISMAQDARKMADTNTAFGIFGTSICATWLANILGERVTFFVDEDTNRQQKQFMGKPVVSPLQAPSQSVIYLALTPKIAALIKKRLHFMQQQLILPPTQNSIPKMIDATDQERY